MSTDFFLKFTSAYKTWGNAEGEPDDWQFEPDETTGCRGKHEGLNQESLDLFQVDQPWLSCIKTNADDELHALWTKEDVRSSSKSDSLVTGDGPCAWRVVAHEGRHRTAWLRNHLGVEYITVVLACYDEDGSAPSVGEMLVDEFASPPIYARISDDTPVGDFKYSLVEA